MIEVWGRRNSSNVAPVMWAIAELDLDHVRHDVGGTFGGLEGAKFFTLNPNRRIPVIQDQGMVLWESNAIIRYLAGKYGQGTLFPNDESARAHSDQWMEWCKTTLYPEFFPIFWQLIRVEKEKQDLELVARCVESTARTLRILERQLTDRDFVAGDSLTMGDLPLGAMAYRYFNLDIQRPELPHIESWYQRLRQRSAYQHHVMIPFGNSLKEWLELELAGSLSENQD